DRGIAVDEEEDRLYGDKRGDELPPELDSPEKIRKKLKELEEASGKSVKRAAKHLIEQYAHGDARQREKIREKLEKAEEELTTSGQTAVSLSDPEARFMENKNHTGLSYNAQITVDHDSGIILANDVTQECTDHQQAEPQLELAEKNLGALPEGTKVSMDNGYFSGANLWYLEQKALDGYIPNSKQAQEQKGKKVERGQYSKDKFVYDEDKDQFICPAGGLLTRKGEYEYDGKSLYTYYGPNCNDCPVRAECAGKQRKRVITSDGYEAERRRMAAKMRSDVGKEEYRNRKETVEWVFGDMKQNMKFREFLTRGTQGAGMEHNLVCTGHNLKILWGKLGRTLQTMGEIGGLFVNLAAQVCGLARLSYPRNLLVSSQD
ncbi:MAG: transposase, partial [Candidatus Methanospirareceae archaeon]